MTATPIAFQNIQVWVKPNPEKPGHYDVRSEPASPQIIDADTVINYQIVDTDGYAIEFKGMSVKPEDNNQLSKESVSVDGRLLTFSDINSVKMTLNITLKFKDSGTGVEFSHDPQIRNNPQ
jgi:hypothetical protein